MQEKNNMDDDEWSDLAESIEDDVECTCVEVPCIDHDCECILCHYECRGEEE